MKTIHIGRSHSNECVLDNPTVSRSHALINLEPDGVHAILKDLNSTHGTYVNGSNKRITSDVRISKSDTLRFGSETITLSAIIEKTNKTVIKPAPTGGVDRRTIGKSPDNQIVMNHDDVSRKHAMLYKDFDGSIVIEDLNSTNGTFVNGVRITSQKLKPGDRVSITRNYPLVWEGVFGKSEQQTTNRGLVKIVGTIVVSAIVVLLCVFVGPKIIDIIGGDDNGGEITMDDSQIHDRYKSSIVLMYAAYYYEVTAGDLDFDIFKQIGINLPKQVVLNREGKPVGLNSPGATNLLKSYSATGFFISNDGRLITNLHVAKPWLFDDEMHKIETMYKMTLQSIANQFPQYPFGAFVSEVKVEGKFAYIGLIPNGEIFDEENLVKCQVLKAGDNASIDVALLRTVSGSIPNKCSYVNTDSICTDPSALTVGKHMYTMGFPAGLSLQELQNGLRLMSRGGSIIQEADEYSFAFDAASEHGASGSPIFDEYGRLIGVLNAGYSQKQGFNYGIKAKHVVDLLNN